MWIVSVCLSGGRAGSSARTEAPNATSRAARWIVTIIFVACFAGSVALIRGGATAARGGIGEKIRIYLVNAGPTRLSECHVIGGLVGRWDIEGATGHDAQRGSTWEPPRGGWVESSLTRKDV